MFVAKGNLEKYTDPLGRIKYFDYNKNSEIVSGKDGNGEVPPGQNVDEDGNIVNNGGNTPPGLNRREKAEKPENPNKPEKPENPGTKILPIRRQTRRRRVPISTLMMS